MQAEDGPVLNRIDWICCTCPYGATHMDTTISSFIRVWRGIENVSTIQKKGQRSYVLFTSLCQRSSWQQEYTQRIKNKDYLRHSLQVKENGNFNFHLGRPIHLKKKNGKRICDRASSTNLCQINAMQMCRTSLLLHPPGTPE